MNDERANPTNYEQLAVELLQNPATAAAVLNEIIEEYSNDEEHFRQIFLSALRDIVRAQSGFTGIAQKTGLNRESLYKTLSENGNPQLGTLLKILKALGFEIQIISSDDRATDQVNEEDPNTHGEPYLAT